jgi:hypothetical protein
MCDRRIQVPIDVAMEEPRSRVVGEETDCDFITSVADTHDVSDDWIDEVVGRVTSATNHVEVMAMQVNRVLSMPRSSD